jgi:thioredoxin-like negative regulator of GroEL
LYRKDLRPIEYLTSRNFETGVLYSEHPFLVFFFSNTCTLYNKEIATLKRVLIGYERQVYIGQINIDSRSPKIQSIQDDCGIREYPTLLVFEGGRITSRFEGYMSLGERRIKTFLRESIGK